MMVWKKKKPKHAHGTLKTLTDFIIGSQYCAIPFILVFGGAVLLWSAPNPSCATQPDACWYIVVILRTRSSLSCLVLIFLILMKHGHNSSYLSVYRYWCLDTWCIVQLWWSICCCCSSVSRHLEAGTVFRQQKSSWPTYVRYITSQHTFYSR